MKLPFRRRGNRSRGQALVEFAIILPVLALLLVMAVDFGRVFFGWVALNNMARAGANFAALHPTSWETPGNATDQADYVLRMQQDANAIDCTLPSPFPTPSFINQVGTSDPHELGDAAEVQLTCGFHLITPLASNLLGGTLTISARAIFPIRQGEIAGAPVTAVIPSPTPTPTATPPPGSTPTPTPSSSALPAGQCRVPQFVGDANNATALTLKWTGAGFKSNHISIKPGSWTSVGSQSQVAAAVLSCNTTQIQVGP
jgi:hypothetical protein